MSLIGLKHKTIVESATYRSQFETLGNAEFVDAELSSLIWGISTKPEAFEIVPGFSQIRLAKTIGPTSLWLLFRIQNDNEVELLWIERDEREIQQ